MNDAANTDPPRARRWSRWARRGLAGAAAVVLIATMALLGQLDHPRIKRGVSALARSAAGVEIDYSAARVRLLQGVKIDGLVVLSPPEFRAIAPRLLRIGRLEVSWSPSSLLRGPRIERVALDDLAVTVVQDEHRGR